MRVLPWWAPVLLVWAASRVVTTAILLSFAQRQSESDDTAARLSYVDFARIWDGNWYWIIATSGYPAQLPLTDDGHVAENAWAFLPVYPMLSRLVGLLLNVEFPVAGLLVSVLAGAGAALVFFRLMSERLPAGSALFAVALFCFAPLSPLFQVDYAESLFALLLALALLLLVRRRYLALLPVVVVLAFTRPGALALALALGIHVVLRWRSRHTDPFPSTEAARAVLVTAVTAISGIAWVVIAGVVTGSPNAYTDTELSWRMPYVGYQELLPFTPWVQGAVWWSAFVGIPAWLGIAALVVLVVGFVAALLSPWASRLGTDMRLWVASYGLYLLAVFFPQSSTFRILFPMFPLLGALAVPRSRVFRAVLLGVFVVLQWGWVHIAWWVDGYDWTPP
jgi:hypothetical protein